MCCRKDHPCSPSQQNAQKLATNSHQNSHQKLHQECDKSAKTTADCKSDYEQPSTTDDPHSMARNARTKVRQRSIWSTFEVRPPNLSVDQLHWVSSPAVWKASSHSKKRVLKQVLAVLTTPLVKNGVEVCLCHYVQSEHACTVPSDGQERNSRLRILPKSFQQSSHQSSYSLRND
jgi:hypothetical protein